MKKFKQKFIFQTRSKYADMLEELKALKARKIKMKIKLFFGLLDDVKDKRHWKKLYDAKKYASWKKQI